MSVERVYNRFGFPVMVTETADEVNAALRTEAAILRGYCEHDTPFIFRCPLCTDEEIEE